jgi:membrane-bound serine protease (ClpP class)
VKTASVRAFCFALALVAALVVAQPVGAGEGPVVRAVHFSAEVNPVTADYLVGEIHRASRDHVAAVVLVVDTPGGLTTSMDKITQAELGAKVPVIVYVSPSGGTAASAGVFIAEAADILAMAPETNIGSSTPIDSSGNNIQSDLRRKEINHYAAKLRGFAKSHGRNGAWADAAVRRAANVTATEALQLHVIDTIAPTLPALLQKIEGTKTKPKGFVLHTAGAHIENVHMSFFSRVLNVLIDPNLLFLLFFAGIAGLGFEVFHPGVVLPGALGAVSLILALFGLSILPTSWGGVVLILLAVALFVIDAHVVSHGALTVAGMVSLVVGGLLLFHNAPSRYHVSLWLLITVAVALGGAWAFALGKAVQVRRRPVTVGVHELVGAPAVVRQDGYVAVRGELWRARSVDGQPLRPGDRVRVEDINGLVLSVRAA